MSSPIDDIARAEFQSLGLTHKQVARIEGAFPLIEMLVARVGPAPNREVREALDSLRASALAAERATRKLCPPTGDRVSGDASLLLQQCLFDLGESYPTEALRQADRLFRAIANAAQKASDSVPQEQARRRISHEPVQLIVRALEDGWGDAWIVVRNTFDPPPEDLPEIPPLLFSGVRGAKERLKRVVEAVYEQIGRRSAGGVSPAWERAYRAYDTAKRRNGS